MTPFKATALAVCISATAQPAFALSCVPPDPAHSYTVARDSPLTYMVVLGRFAVNDRSHTTSEGDAAPEVSWTGRLTGMALDAGGFDKPFDAEIAYRAFCWGDDLCPGAPVDTQMIAFITLHDSGPVLTTDTCEAWIIRDPTPEDIAVIETCHKGDACALRY